MPPVFIIYLKLKRAGWSFLGYINLLSIKTSILYKDIVKCSDFKDKIFEFFLTSSEEEMGNWCC